MTIEGNIGNGGLGVITAFLLSQKHNIQSPISFYVDTGASQTLICDKDAKRIGIDYNKLPRSPVPVSGIGGDVSAYDLDNCMLVFKFGTRLQIENVDSILILRHESDSEKERAKIMVLPSLLGLDILKRYRLSFYNYSVKLEK
jgi:hypothetical protein